MGVGGLVAGLCLPRLQHRARVIGMLPARRFHVVTDLVAVTTDDLIPGIVCLTQHGLIDFNDAIISIDYKNCIMQAVEQGGVVIR